MAEDVRAEVVAVGERLGWLERALRLNGNQIAAELGISRQRWSMYKVGQREVPISLAGEMRKRWGCALDWLYLGEEEHNRADFKLRLSEARRKAAPGRAGQSRARGTRNKAVEPSRA